VFRVQEPITDALRTTASDSYIFYKDLCSAGFQTMGSSLGVINENNELVGIALNCVYNYNELPKILATQKSDFTRGKLYLKMNFIIVLDIVVAPYPTRNANRLVVFIEHVEAGLFARLTPTARVFKCDILCVGKFGIYQFIISHLGSK
jgi:hypothetical protein